MESIVHASTVNTESVNQKDTTSLLDQADKYVFLNGETEQFELSSQASEALSASDLTIIKAQLTKANSEVSSAKNNGLPVTSDSSDKTVLLQSTLYVGATLASSKSKGKTATKMHWNYARVYLSISKVHDIGSGVSIGSMFIPVTIVAAACSALGVLYQKVDRGIWFDYNYFKEALMKGNGVYRLGWQ